MRSVALIITLLVGFGCLTARPASAQQLEGRVAVGIATPLFRFERMTFTRIDITDQPSDPLASGVESTSSTVSLGLGSDAHAGDALSAPLLVTTHCGYAVSDAFILALRIGGGFASSSGDAGQDAKHWSLAIGPRAEYLFGSGFARPFAGLELGLLALETSGGVSPRFEQSGQLWSVGPTGGVYLFAGDVLAFDLRAGVSYSAGSQSQEISFAPGTLLADVPIVASRQQETDVSRIDVVLALGLSAWL